MYLGLALLIAPASFRYILRSESNRGKSLGLGAFGFFLLAAFSVFTLTLTPISILGRFDWLFFSDYARNSAQGSWTAVRLLAGIILWALLLAKPRFLSSFLASVVTALLIASFSSLSHTASLGILPFAADFLHGLAASIWVGLIVAVSLLPNWKTDQDLPSIVLRLSRVAQLSVAVIAVTGLYGAVVNLSSFSALWSSRYGLSLVLKLGFFGMALAVAAFNHWRFLPQLIAGNRLSLRRALYLEIIFLVSVLATTGLLSVTDPA